MKINTIPKIAEEFKHPVIKGKRYFFMYSDGIPSFSDFYDVKYYYTNTISVLFTEEELKKFRPKDNTHQFLKTLNTQAINQKQMCVFCKINFI